MIVRNEIAVVRYHNKLKYKVNIVNKKKIIIVGNKVAVLRYNLVLSNDS